MGIIFSTTKNARKNGVKVLVYGKPGTGKTVLCSTAPKPIILSAESGLLSLRHADIPVINIDSFEALEEAYEWVLTNEKAKQFDTICLDSISEIAEIVLADSKLGKIDVRQAYVELQDKTIGIIKKFRDLEGKNVYFSAKEAKLINQKTGEITYLPMMPGTKLGDAIPYLFDEVFNIGIYINEQSERKHFLRTLDNGQYFARDRSGILNEIEETNLSKIFDKINAERKEND